jgi:hypothetical protein
LELKKYLTHRAYVPYVDDEGTVHMFHLDSELIFKENAEELGSYPYAMTDEVEDPEEEAKARALAAAEAAKAPPPTDIPPEQTPAPAATDDPKTAAEEAEDVDDKGIYGSHLICERL